MSSRSVKPAESLHRLRAVSWWLIHTGWGHRAFLGGPDHPDGIANGKKGNY